jgi:hypothetical protein
MGCPFVLQYTSIVINMAIQHIELKMGTTQNDATNMMIDVSPFYEVAFSRRFL